jgi:hypothetical protein
MDTKTYEFLIWCEIGGGHVHMRCFVKSTDQVTWQKMGDLCCNRGQQFVQLSCGLMHPNKVQWKFVEGQTFEEACRES